MNAFAFAIDAMFQDPNMGVDAVYRAGGAGPAVPLRVMRRSPDRMANFGDGRFVTDSLLLDFRVADVPSPAVGDTFEVAGEIFELRADPVRDSERLVWAGEVRLVWSASVGTPAPQPNP